MNFLIIIIVVEHVIILLKQLIAILINDKPEDVIIKNRDKDKIECEFVERQKNDIHHDGDDMGFFVSVARANVENLSSD